MSDFKLRSRGVVIFRRILSIKFRVYKALVIRFVIQRYGRNNIGFMWTIVEPMLLCVGVMAIWSLTKGHVHHGISMVAFVFTGYMPLTLWRHQTGYLVNIGKSSKFLTIFHNLNILDAIIARLLLEFFSVTAASLIVFMILYSFNILNYPHSVGIVVQGWLLFGLLCSSAGLLVGGLSELSDIVEKLNPPLQYFILPFSGCFFMVEWLPDSIKQYALYIPLVNCYEIIRGGFYGPEFPTYGDPIYVVTSSILTFGAGFYIYEHVKNNIDS